MNIIESREPGLERVWSRLGPAPVAATLKLPTPYTTTTRTILWGMGYYMDAAVVAAAGPVAEGLRAFRSLGTVLMCLSRVGRV